MCVLLMCPSPVCLLLLSLHRSARDWRLVPPLSCGEASGSSPPPIVSRLVWQAIAPERAIAQRKKPGWLGHSLAAETPEHIYH